MSARRGAARVVAAALAATPAALLACAALAGAAHAQLSLSLSAAPAPLVVRAAGAGLPPAPAASVGTLLTVVGVSLTRQKLTAQLDRSLPPGVQLETQLTVPIGAVSLGWVALGTGAREVVTELLPASVLSLGVYYRASATVQAGVVASTTRTVTYTLVAAP